MNDQPFPHDPSRGTPSPEDERIDALARSAGNALRRPAPADGIAGVQRAGRRRRAIQTSAAGAAVAIAAVIGVVAFGDGDRRTAVVPATADTTADTTGTSGDVSVPTTDGSTATSVPPIEPEPPATPPVTPPPTGGEDSTTTSEPPAPAAGAPSVVYGSDAAIDTGGSIQTQYDSQTGAALSTGPMDGDASLAAQQQWYGGGASPIRYLGTDESDRPGTIEYVIELGRYGLRHAVLPSEIPTLDDQDPAALPFFDRCQQAELIAMDGLRGLPERALGVTATADRRFLVVLRADCPVDGTLDQGALEGGYDVIVEAYDLTTIGQPGRQLFAEPVESCGCTLAGFSHDGRFVAIRQFAGDLRFRAFDLATGTEVEVAPDCDQSFTAFADQYGPWVGDSTLALVADCGTGPELLVMDAADPYGAASFAAPTAEVTWAEVDVEHLADPASAWYVVCGTDDLTVPSTCWIGHGDDALVPLDGAATASFLPLGFRAGG